MKKLNFKYSANYYFEIMLDSCAIDTSDIITDNRTYKVNKYISRTDYYEEWDNLYYSWNKRESSDSLRLANYRYKKKIIFNWQRRMYMTWKHNRKHQWKEIKSHTPLYQYD